MLPVNHFRLKGLFTFCLLSLGLISGQAANAYDCTPEGSDIQNGTSITVTLNDSYGDGNSGTGTITGPNSYSATIDAFSTDSWTRDYCLPDGLGYVLSYEGGYDSWYWDEFSYSVVFTTSQETIIAGGNDAIINHTFDVGEFPGCNNMTASNYDPNTNVNDGSCVCAVGTETAISFELTDSWGDGNTGSGVINSVVGVTIASTPGIANSGASNVPTTDIHTVNLCPEDLA